MIIRENVPLAPLTTLGVGGPARYFAEPTTEAEIVEAVEFSRSQNVPLFVLGGGSNLVVADTGFAGLVLKIAIAKVTRRDSTFTAGAGCDWDALVAQTIELGYAGLECLSGIPGTVGGTPVQNVGAFCAGEGCDRAAGAGVGEPGPAAHRHAGHAEAQGARDLR